MAASCQLLHLPKRGTYVLSDPYVDVALAGVREPQLVKLKNDISDDVESRIDLAELHDRYVR